ncbi:YceI family protein [Psychroserpens sp.]|uniref:YceI family protein n=1 Tax=Psychroserpens sp. TaxID=2020870 RepID=UPI001B0AF8D4|nr:YceI family protein [Psychroserpens sp.]MBO6605778.1 YceI family protein [Psychroserpens sp.]MBO6631458.1 YceI family protein [Psychroserpens sp.]MBO6652851.1 YceI family protein [Psychroserpens sp.]MBO6681377.1 YceI family protein [Psychroserpens sp.]MBO6749152.1 YceI family protein [Psychroserpens sp.]
MKNLKHTFVLLLSLVFVTAWSQNQKLNTKNSTFSWTGKAAFNAYALTGSLKAEKGQVTINNDKIESLNVIINMKSLDHENSDLKSHLRSADFFEVTTYTKATFKLIKPAKIENGKATVIGMMTIKGQSKQETIELTIKEDTLSFSHIMDRTAYGIKYNSPSFFKKMKENAIADNFELKGTLVFK